MHACHTGCLSCADCFRTGKQHAPNKAGAQCLSSSRSFQLQNKRLTWKNTWLRVSFEVRSTASATLNSHLQFTMSTVTQLHHGFMVMAANMTAVSTHSATPSSTLVWSPAESHWPSFACEQSHKAGRSQNVCLLMSCVYRQHGGSQKRSVLLMPMLSTSRYLPARSLSEQLHHQCHHMPP